MVVQLGGFAPAADYMNRSQSTISYSVARLQEKLGIKLFEMKGRRACLTELGRALLVDAEPHLAGFRGLEQRAQSLASGGESEIRISVDALFPNDRLFTAIADFSQEFPTVRTKLRQSTFLSADSEFSAHNAHLCITGLVSREYFIQPVVDIQMIAVAHKDHPLHAPKRQISRVEMMRHMLTIIEGANPGLVKQQPRGSAQRFLPVSTIEAAISAVQSQLCFGWLPKYRIKALLDSGELRPLRLATGGIRLVRLNLVCKDVNSGSREFLALAKLLGLQKSPMTI